MATYHTRQLPGRTVEINGGEHYLWFSGTDYLGMGHNEDLRRYITLATETFGNHYGSSRNNSLRLDIYEEAETHLADFLNAPAAMIVSSGMWAGQLMMKEVEALLPGTPDVSYHYAPGVHPALWGNRFQRQELEWREWAELTVQKINGSASGSAHIICSDAVGSPLVKAFDFSLFNALKDPAQVWLVIDESHSLGVLGNEGRGTLPQFDQHVLPQTIFVSSLNKAMGIPAGAIWGAPTVIEAVQKSPWYAGASPPAPAYAYALKMLLEQDGYRAAHALLMENIAYFNQRASGSILFESVANYPVFCSPNAALFDHLLENGIMASCFPYPSASDAPVTRIAISTMHQKADLDRLAEVCEKFIA